MAGAGECYHEGMKTLKLLLLLLALMGLTGCLEEFDNTQATLNPLTQAPGEVLNETCHSSEAVRLAYEELTSTFTSLGKPMDRIVTNNSHYAGSRVTGHPTKAAGMYFQFLVESEGEKYFFNASVDMEKCQVRPEVELFSAHETDAEGNKL
jgi:hypothetical protein